MAKKAKKRGVKPGTKRGPYKKKGRKRIAKQKEFIVTTATPHEFKVGDKITFSGLQNLKEEREKLISDIKAYAPSPVLTLCGQLEDSILLLEQRISNAIAKINSLM